MKEGGNHQKLDLTQYYETLGLKESDAPAVKVIDKAYKRAALRAHPDKGGDSHKFKAVTDAYELIMSSINETEENKKYKTVTVVCNVKKREPGVGFGMVVVEDSKTGDIVVKEVLASLTLVGQTIPEGETVVKGDVVIGIDKDDSSQWPLSRVVARLNNFRVPTNTSVSLTFRRKVRIDGGKDREDKPDLAIEDTKGSALLVDEKKSAEIVLQIETLQTRIEDLELDLTNTKEALTLAEATLGSLKRSPPPPPLELY